MKEVIKDSINWEQQCWKYFKLDRFIENLENGYIYFAAANQFEDIFEGATHLLGPQTSVDNIKHFDLINHAFKELQRLTKISCWHKSDCESIGMWKFYAEDKKGIAITTTPKKMKEAIQPFKLEPQFCEEELYVGNVEYIDLTSQHLNETMLGPFFYKHQAYSDENELRLAISLRIAEEFGVRVPQKGIHVQVDFSKLIDNIVIGPNIEINERNRLMKVLENKELKSRIKNSCLTYYPIFY